jgi:hypothetical protein
VRFGGGERKSRMKIRIRKMIRSKSKSRSRRSSAIHAGAIAIEGTYSLA